MPTSPPDLPITEAAARLRDGSLSAVALLEAHLARIAARDPTIHAFVGIDAERALAAATAADRALARGEDTGPLLGIPIAVKDVIDVAGSPTACGSRLRVGAVATADAMLVTRLRAAGAVPVGKLATYEFALVGPTFDAVAPPAVNPWSPEHVTGGSSSGSAAAVAAGMLRTAIGTDTGGSIRSPAGYCGVVGLKPTRGRVSAAGVFPLSPSLDHPGPISTSVADAALTFDAMAEPRPDAVPAAAWLDRDVAGLRIAYARAWFADDPALMPDVLRAVDDAVSKLGQLGARVAEVAMPDYAVMEAAGAVILDAEAFEVHREALAVTSAGYGRAAIARLLPGACLDAADLAEARRAADRLRRRIDADVFARHDALVTVNTLTTAPLVAPYRDGLGGWTPMRTLPFNVTGHPALALPAGFVGGLPVSVQLVGPALSEALICRIGAALERATGHGARRPQAEPPALGRAS